MYFIQSSFQLYVCFLPHLTTAHQQVKLRKGTMHPVTARKSHVDSLKIVDVMSCSLVEIRRRLGDTH